MSGLIDRKVLVVGASAGVGRAFAVRAVAQGAQVVLAARRADRLAEVVVEAGGGRAVVADVSRDGDAERLVEAAVAELGAVDLLFHAVGTAPLRLLVETSADDWRRVLETNVIGLQRVLAALVPQAASGAIAAVLSSETVGRPRPSLGAYGASKAALSESLRAWRLEHPEVRFSCVALGATQPTEFGGAFDMDALGPVLTSWVRHGLMQQEYMETGDVASILADLFGSALTHPSVGIDEIVLRSPSPVLGLRPH